MMSLNLYLLLIGNHLENKATTNPLRKAHGAAVYPLNELLTACQNGDQDERDVQMDVYVCVLCTVMLAWYTINITNAGAYLVSVASENARF